MTTKSILNASRNLKYSRNKKKEKKTFDQRIVFFYLK